MYTDTAGQVITTDIIEVIAILWVSDQAAGKDIATDDDFLLSDKNGQRIVGKRAKFAGDDLAPPLPKPFWANGLTVTTMDGGVCYVITGDRKS